MANEAKIRITAKDDTAEGIQKAKAQLRSLATEAASVGSAFGKFGPALGAAFSAIALGQFKGVVDGLDKLNDLKDATGSTIENLSALEDVARRTGTPLETVESSLLKLNKTLSDAKPGSDAAQVFEDLGLSIKALKGLDPAEALLEVSKALGGFADDGNKARAAQELFGRSLKDVAPLLNDLAAAGKLNKTLTEDQTKAAEKFNNQLRDLEKNALDLSRSLAGPVVEAFNALFDRIGDNKRKGGGVFDFLSNEYKRVTREGLELIGVVDKVREVAIYSNEGRNRPRPSLPDRDGKGGKGDKDRLDRLRVTAANFSDYATEIAESVARVVKESDSLKLQKLVDQFAELDKLQSAGLDPALIADARRRLLPKPEDFGPPIPQELLDRQEELNRLLGSTPTAQLEAQRTLMQDLATAYERGQLGAIGSEEAVRRFGEAAQTALGTLPDLANEANTAAQELGRTFASAAESAVINFKDVGSVLKGLEQDLLRFITQQAVTKPLEASLTKFLAPASGPGGIDFGKVFGSIAGAFSGFFAEGGYIPAGRWGIAGERGPEPVFGGRTGVSVRSASQGSVVNHFHLGAPTSKETQQQIAWRTGDAVRRAMARNG